MDPTRMADRLWKQSNRPAWQFHRNAAWYGLFVHVMLIAFTCSQLQHKVFSYRDHTNIARIWFVIDFPSSIVTWLVQSYVVGQTAIEWSNLCFLMLCLVFGGLQWFLITGWIFSTKARHGSHKAAKKTDPFAD